MKITLPDGILFDNKYLISTNSKHLSNIENSVKNIMQFYDIQELIVDNLLTVGFVYNRFMLFTLHKGKIKSTIVPIEDVKFDTDITYWEIFKNNELHEFVYNSNNLTLRTKMDLIGGMLVGD